MFAKSSTETLRNDKEQKEQYAEKIRALTDRADQAIKNNGDAQAAADLEYWKQLLEESHRRRRRYFSSISSTILDGILEDKRVSDISEDLKSEIERQNDLYDRPWMRAKRRGWTPTDHIVFGLLLLLVSVIAGGVSDLLSINFDYLDNGLGFNRESVSTICAMGAMGGLVSVVIRIQDYANMKDIDPMVLILIGYFRPIIGMVFAFFVFAAFASDIVPISLNQGVGKEQQELFYVGLAFLSGFSERLARDIVVRTELSVSTGSNSEK